MTSIKIKPASRDDARKLLRLTLATPGQSAAERENHVTRFIEYARQLSLDLSRQWVSMAGDHVVAACTCIESPGRTAMLFLPDAEVAEVEIQTVSDLVRHVVDQESERDVRLLQCLIRPDDSQNRAALERVGFRDIATLLYMEWNAEDEAVSAGPPLPVGLEASTTEWITYNDARHDEFARLIAATYVDSLDCPDLCGLRDIDDVITGHKSAGRFLPDRWLLLRCRGQPVGCILFGENPLQPTLELVYMGIHPNWRRMGIGKFLLLDGLSRARREQFTNVTLAVDAANAIALAMYKSAGFRETTRRRAMIRALIQP